MTGLKPIPEVQIAFGTIKSVTRQGDTKSVTEALRCHGSRGRLLHRPSPFQFRRLALSSLSVALISIALPLFAETTNSVAVTPPLPSAVPDVLSSLGRVMLALAVVLGVFFAGVWLVRNWQRLVVHRGHAPRLNVLEVRSLGGRQALYVVGYDQERFLIASSPAGVNFLSHLQSADPADEQSSGEKPQPPPSFAQALTKVLKGK